MTPKPLVLNQSSLKAFLGCQRLYGWIRLQDLTSPIRRSAPSIGVGVHSGLASFHVDGDLPKALDATREKLQEEVGPKVGASFEDKSVDEAQAIAEDLVADYVEHWIGEEELWSPLNQEIEFLVEVGEGTGIFLRGRADNLSTVKGALCLVDYKTAGKMDPRDLLKYELDLQLTGYIYGLSKQLTQDSLKEGGPPIRVEGIIVDLLVKTKIPQFARESFTRSDEELREFEQEFIEYGNRIRQQLARVEAGEDWKVVFPRNTEHCFKWGGACAFRDLCLKDTPIRRKLYDARKPDYVDEAAAQLFKEWEEGKKP